MRESDVRRKVVAKLRRLGWEVLCYSDNRTSRNTPGAPDTLVAPPRGKAVFFWEAKSDTGKPSAEQLRIKARIEASGTPVIIGGEAEVDAHLKALGLITRTTQ